LSLKLSEEVPWITLVLGLDPVNHLTQRLVIHLINTDQGMLFGDVIDERGVEYQLDNHEELAYMSDSQVTVRLCVPAEYDHVLHLDILVLTKALI
jgi:hypothetical protein